MSRFLEYTFEVTTVDVSEWCLMHKYGHIITYPFYIHSIGATVITIGSRTTNNQDFAVNISRKTYDFLSTIDDKLQYPIEHVTICELAEWLTASSKRLRQGASYLLGVQDGWNRRLAEREEVFV